MAYAAHEFVIKTSRLPSIAGSQTQMIVVRIAAIGPVVAAEILPKVLHRIQFRAVGSSMMVMFWGTWSASDL